MLQRDLPQKPTGKNAKKGCDGVGAGFVDRNKKNQQRVMRLV